MTAEIALLNKVAVALAADSAATISTEEKDEKVFNSEDKLFQLSDVQPIGIMIYNAPFFLETPIQILIKQYRSLRRSFKTIDAATADFKEFLNDFGKSLTEEVRQRSLSGLMSEPTRLISERITKEIKRLQDQAEPINIQRILDESLAFYEDIFDKSGRCEFLNRSGQAALRSLANAGRKFEKAEVPGEEEIRGRDRFVKAQLAFLRGAYPSRRSIGMVIAGYAKDELFPSLRSFEIDGMIGNSIRFFGTKRADILFEGPSAQIIPFAQQQMVDRFVCGIDATSQRSIEKLCKGMLQDYRSELMGIFDLESDDDRAALEGRLQKAESIFLQRLGTEGFSDLKDKATADLESMIEFMPKPDLAQMAEALVELTSIKRRVSKGFDTVGGPIDVAVISKSEGFIWIKRKHYFQPERNARYLARLSERVTGVESHGTERKPQAPRRRKRATNRRKAVPPAPREGG